MMIDFSIDLPMEKIKTFCERWRVSELALFGSVLRDDFNLDSDVDVMVRFAPETKVTFTILDQMVLELMDIFDRKVDLVTRQGIEASRNYLRRHEILSSAQIIYATRSTVPT